MAILKRIYAAAFACLLLTSCYENFTPDIESTPVMSLKALVTAGEPFEVKVGRTWLYSDVDGYTNHEVADANLKICANGQPIGPDYEAQEGDVITIAAEHPAYGTANAEVKVPNAVPFKMLKWTPTITSTWWDQVPGYAVVGDIRFEIDAELEISDPKNSTDYYHFSYMPAMPALTSDDVEDDPLDASHHYPLMLGFGNLRYDAEPIFSEHIGLFESIMGSDSFGFTFFTDRQFTGETYTLHIHIDNCICTLSVRAEDYTESLFDCGLDFVVGTISESFYSWAMYVWHQSEGMLGDLGDIGFGEPIGGYSNVSTGAGIVAAQSCVTCTLSLKEFLFSAIAGHGIPLPQ